MEMYTVLFMAVCACAVVYGNVEVKFVDPTTRYAKVGERLTFNCHINKDLLYVMTNNFQIIHVPATTNEEVLMVDSGKRFAAQPSLYNISFQINPENVTMEFVMYSATDDIEGKLICRSSSATDTPVVAEQSLDIVIIRALESLKQQINGLNALSQSTEVPIRVKSGKYEVKCIAEGSNPATEDVQLFLHANKIDPLHLQNEKMDTHVIKYRTTLTASVELTLANSKQYLKCTAKSKAQDYLEVKVPIDIIVYEPAIVCNDTSAYPGKMYPVLVCLVNHTGLDIKSFKYELEYSGEVIAAGDQNKDFVEVLSKKLTPTITEVHLKLYQAKGHHFDKNFVLLVEQNDGHVSRQPVRLIKSEDESGNEGRRASRDGGNSSHSPSLSLAVFILSVVWSWLYS